VNVFTDERGLLLLSQLSGDSVRYASDILANLTRRMYLISTHSSRLDQSISVAALDTTANILTAVSTTGRMTRQEARQVVSTSTQAIERILQVSSLSHFPVISLLCSVNVTSFHLSQKAISVAFSPLSTHYEPCQPGASPVSTHAM